MSDRLDDIAAHYGGSRPSYCASSAWLKIATDVNYLLEALRASRAERDEAVKVANAIGPDALRTQAVLRGQLAQTREALQQIRAIGHDIHGDLSSDECAACIAATVLSLGGLGEDRPA